MPTAPATARTALPRPKLAWAVLHALDDHVHDVLGATSRLSAQADSGAGSHRASSLETLGDDLDEPGTTLRAVRLDYAGPQGASVQVRAHDLDGDVEDPDGPRLHVEVSGTGDDEGLARELVHRAVDVRPASAGGGDAPWGPASVVVLLRSLAGDAAGAVRRLVRR